MAAILTPSGRLALNPTEFAVANQTLSIGTISPASISGAGASANDVLTWNGTTWGPAAGGGASATTVEVDLGLTPRTSGRFTITDATISATSKVLVWQAPGPYTGKGTLADEAAMQPVSVIAVAPASGSCVVHWETPPIIVAAPVTPNGRRDAPSTVAGFNPRYPTVAFETKRIGKVSGNVKFSYMILA